MRRKLPQRSCRKSWRDFDPPSPGCLNSAVERFKMTCASDAFARYTLRVIEEGCHAASPIRCTGPYPSRRQKRHDIVRQAPINLPPSSPRSTAVPPAPRQPSAAANFLPLPLTPHPKPKHGGGCATREPAKPIFQSSFAIAFAHAALPFFKVAFFHIGPGPCQMLCG